MNPCHCIWCHYKVLAPDFCIYQGSDSHATFPSPLICQGGIGRPGGLVCTRWVCAMYPHHYWGTWAYWAPTDPLPTATAWTASSSHNCCRTQAERIPATPGTHWWCLNGAPATAVTWVMLPPVDLGRANAHAMCAVPHQWQSQGKRDLQESSNVKG